MNYVRFLHDMENRRNIKDDDIDVFISIFKTDYFNKIDKYISFLSENNQNLIKQLYIENIGKEQAAIKFNIDVNYVYTILTSIFKKIYKYILNDTYAFMNDKTPFSVLDISANICMRLFDAANCVEDLVILLNNSKIKGLGIENNNLVIKAIKDYNKTVNNDKLEIESITSSKDLINKLTNDYKENKINIFDYLSKLSNNQQLILYRNEYSMLFKRLNEMLNEISTDLLKFNIDETKRNGKVTLKINLTTESKIKLIRQYQLDRIVITII